MSGLEQRKKGRDEVLAGGSAVISVSAPDAVQRYIQSFERACDTALEPEDTTVYLERLARRTE